MFKRICKITFISHGATVYSLDGIINDTLKYPKINEFGEEEIDKVCEYLQKRGVAYDKIYTSPNGCCVETAQIIAKLFKQKATPIDLTQRNHGDWHGSFYSELFKEYGSTVLTQTPNNGEALADFNKRVSKVIDKILSDSNLYNKIALSKKLDKLIKPINKDDDYDLDYVCYIKDIDYRNLITIYPDYGEWTIYFDQDDEEKIFKKGELL